jgi:uncharacterized lipoprotein YmbA
MSIMPQPQLQLLGVIVIIFLAGCAGSEITRFYLLTPIPVAETASQAAGIQQPMTLGIRSVELPPYLDRPQIVTRTGPHEINLAELNHWAEPLQDNATRVLVENLAALIPSDWMVSYPWTGQIPVDYQVAVKVIRFDLTAAEDSVLIARWRILGKDGNDIISERKSIYRIRPDGSDYPAIVSAMNQTLADFSREIAEAIRDLPK